jgi:hypothetical protein
MAQNRVLLIDSISIFNPISCVLKESKGKNGGLLVKGILQRADSINHNKRMYSKKLMTEQVEKYKSKIQEGLAYGELDHPERADTWLSEVSHVFKDIWWEGDDICGIAEIMDWTPKGNLLKQYFDKGHTVGISSRGVGSLREAGLRNGAPYYEVGEDYEMVAFDFVSNPSTQGAFMSPVVMKESKSYFVNVDTLADEILNMSKIL